MKRAMLLGIVVAAMAAFGATAEAQGYRWGGGSHWGHGHSGWGDGHSGSYYRGGGRYYPQYRTWHDTSHYDYHPGSFQRHRNHYHYVPGHYDYHRQGHYHWR